jgi:hypothetical protein
MKHYKALAQKFLLMVTPLLATSTLVTSVTSVCKAATFASSTATFRIEEFNRNPLDVRTITDSATNVISRGSRVNADAGADAIFISNPNPKLTFASNSSFSTANGQGNEYFGLGQSFAKVIGYDFMLDAGEKLSFDFNGLVNIATSIGNPRTESAKADGMLAFELYDSKTWTLLDFLTISGNVTTLGNGDALDIDKSVSVSLDTSQTSLVKYEGGTQESVGASIRGNYSRTFDKLTYLTLVEMKRNQASVKALEPSNMLALLFTTCMVCVAFKGRTDNRLTESN